MVEEEQERNWESSLLWIPQAAAAQMALEVPRPAMLAQPVLGRRVPVGIHGLVPVGMCVPRQELPQIRNWEAIP